MSALNHAASSQQFSGLLVAAFGPDAEQPQWGSAIPASISFTQQEESYTVQVSCPDPHIALQAPVRNTTLGRINKLIFVLSSGQASDLGSLLIKCPDAASAEALHQAFTAASQHLPGSSHAQEPVADRNHAPSCSSQQQPDCSAVVQTSHNHFDRKTDKGSAEMYFHYYGMLMHQQNMLQDYTRTGSYYSAILGNPSDFKDKVVMDVGAGSGILSIFAAQAGAKKVYAVEASNMAKFARMLASSNPAFGSRIEVVNRKVEEADLPEKVDVLVSEPMGTLLVNERMLETYLYARDHFLKPGGKMFPQLGRIHVALFQDEPLYLEIMAKSTFWLERNFYGVDLSSLYQSAKDGYFAQVVVDAFDPSVLTSTCMSHVIDFGSCPESDLHTIRIPLQLMVTAPVPCTIHGVACWFDVFFNGSTTPLWLSTAPGLPTTHWFQLRCVLQQPLTIAVPNTVISGELLLQAHSRQSYDVHVTLSAPAVLGQQVAQTSSGMFDLKEPYYRQLTQPTVQLQWQQQAMAATAQGMALALEQQQQVSGQHMV